MSNGLAVYTVVMTLVFHHILTPISAVGFGLMDSDRLDITKAPVSAKRQRAQQRRLRFKGAQAFDADENPLDPAQGFTLKDLFRKTHDVIDLLWAAMLSPEAAERTHFAIAVAFWPRDLHKDDMRKRITTDMLKTLCSLKWRIIYKEVSAPYNLIDFALADRSDGDAAESAVKAFMDTKECCLDPFWGRPAQKDCQNHPADAPDILKQHLESFIKNCRGVTHREEKMHATQRIFAGTNTKRAPLFTRQSAEMVLRTSATNYEMRMGGSLKAAARRVRTAARTVRKGKVLHKRPNQLGSTLIFYMNKLKQQNTGLTNVQMKQQWHDLSPAEKQSWKRQHIVSTGQSRLAARVREEKMAAEEEDALQFANKTPWQIGSNRFPLQERFICEFIDQFRSRNQGIAALSQVKTPESEQFLREISDGKKYHSMDACVLAAKANVGQHISADSPLVGQIMQAERCKGSCLDKHPGVCTSSDAAHFPSIESLVQSLPRGQNVMLMVQRIRCPAKEQFVLYVRAVTGPCGV